MHGPHPHLDPRMLYISCNNVVDPGIFEGGGSTMKLSFQREGGGPLLFLDFKGRGGSTLKMHYFNPIWQKFTKKGEVPTPGTPLWIRQCTGSNDD